MPLEMNENRTTASAGYYAGRNSEVTRNHRTKKLKSGAELALTFVTIGALLGIKLIGGHAKHVVTLDADAVDEIVGRRRCGLGCFAGFRWQCLG
jgi:hypothetical protein